MPETAVLLVALLIAVVVAIILIAMIMRRISQAQSRESDVERIANELHGERAAALVHATEAGELRGRLGALVAELEASDQRRADADRQLDDARAAHESERLASRAASMAMAARESELALATRRCVQAEEDLGRARAELATLQQAYAQSSANLEHARRAHAEMQAWLDQAQSKLTGTFAELAGKVFDERGQAFEKNVREATAQGKSDFETMLKPFADKLGEFRSRVDTLYNEEAKERAALLGAVTQLKTLNQDMAGQTDALTRALKGNSRVRGDWGELMLENVLRGSGLEEGQHYSRQADVRDEDGRLLRPDIVVRLPDERTVVIDSKVNLLAWQDAMNAVDDPASHGVALQRHADGLRTHVRELAKRDYPKALDALDITIAFVPIEGALSAALGADPSLQTFAFEKKVAFASPNTLMALLRVVDRLWARDRMQREAVAIGESGGLVLDALMGFLTEFDSVGKKLEDARTSFQSARGRLSESRQSVIRRAQRLTELGVKGRKVLSEELRSEAQGLLAERVDAVAPEDSIDDRDTP